MLKHERKRRHLTPQNCQLIHIVWLTISMKCAILYPKGLIHMNLMDMRFRHKYKKGSSVYKMILCGLFAAIMAVCSWISIPTTVPFTLQTLAVFCTLAILGGQLGTVSVIVYLLVGLAGVPVFAGFSGGISAFLTPSGGYLVGFVFTALVYWAITAVFGEKLIVKIAALAVGAIVCYVFGTAWFIVFYSHNAEPVGIFTALSWCVFPFIIPDAVKLAAAVVISRRLSKYAGLSQKAV